MTKTALRMTGGTMKKRQVPLRMPDLGIEGHPMTVSLWFARRGRRVVEGEPLVEILCGPATVDLPAPAGGILVEKTVLIEEEVREGQILAVVKQE
jgi:pyruvate/2-oxoglutarate dehydrogenase complex dihydrolipoamide acyltransferase (E2) component